MSEDRKKTATPPRQEKKSEAAKEREDFSEGWSPWREWDLPPSIRDWEPEEGKPERRERRSGSHNRERRNAAARKPRPQERQESLSPRQAIAQKRLHFRRRWRRIVRENKAHRFPESERLPIQLMLFFWGLLPMWGSLLQERVLQKNSASRQKSAQSAQKKRRWHLPGGRLRCGGGGVVLLHLYQRRHHHL